MLLPAWIVGSWIAALLRELALWGGVLLLLASGLSFYVGWNQRRNATLVSETPRSEIRDLQPPAVVRVRGTVTPAVDRDAFTAPITGDQECVLSAWEIEEMYDTPKTRSWEAAACGVRSVPFYVEDESGTLLVDVADRVVGNETDDVLTPERILEPNGVSMDGLRCRFESFDVHVETDYEESPPRSVAEFVQSTDGISLEPMATDFVVDASKRKYYEQTLQAGDQVSVLGYATTDDAAGSPAGSRYPTVTPSTEATLQLSTHPLEESPDGGGGLLFGALTGIVGIALLAAVSLL